MPDKRAVRGFLMLALAMFGLGLLACTAAFQPPQPDVHPFASTPTRMGEGLILQPTAVPDPTPTPNGHIGDRVPAGGMALTVQRTFNVSSIREFITPKPGNTFLVTENTIENVSREGGAVNILNFEVRDAQGNMYQPEILAPEPSLSSGDVAIGERVHGNVAFEVPQSAQGFVMLWKPDFFAQPIRIELRKPGG